jgi:hypothetical protein
MTSDSTLPSNTEKPDLLEWLETLLPFKFPRIPLVQMANNLDKAAASIVCASGANFAARIKSSTSRIEARTEAERTLIEFGQRQIAEGSNELAGRALNYAIGDAIRKQTNREEILKLAADDLAAALPKDDASHPIRDDWLDAFKQYAESKSSADIQQLWSRILSSEIRKPGSVSLRTLSFLSTISGDDATFIVKAFAFVIDESGIPSWHAQKNLLYADFLRLYDLGVITVLPGIAGAQYEKASAPAQIDGRDCQVAWFIYFGHVVGLQSDTTGFSVSISVCPLSHVGIDLFRISNSTIPNFEAVESLALSLRKPEISHIWISPITDRQDNKIAFEGRRIIFGNNTPT